MVPATYYLTHFGTTLRLFRSRPVFSKIAGVICVFQNWIRFWIILIFSLMGTLKQENEVFLFSWSSSGFEIVKPLWVCFKRLSCLLGGRQVLTHASHLHLWETLRMDCNAELLICTLGKYDDLNGIHTGVLHLLRTCYIPASFLGDFLFSGSRIASWLPSFSVEVMHTTNILGIAQASNSQLNAMVRLLQCFGPQPSCLCEEGKSCI